MSRYSNLLSGKRLLAALVFILLLAGGFAPAVYANDDENIALLDRSGKAIASVVKKASPAVVNVRVEKSVAGRDQDFGMFNDPLFERFFGPQFRHPGQGEQKEFKQQAAGSGFIIADDGLILTNNHVVSEADTITVKLSDEREFKAKVVGTDPQSDVALIRIDAKNLPVLPLGDSDKIDVGEWVIAIGSPFELNQSVTVGVVSAKGRNRIGINDYENFIQTDAAINPGNSGGPLLNVHGEAIGMNTAIFSRSGGYMGIGFAIPINMAKNVQQQLLKTGKVIRGWLGVVIQDVDEELAKSFGLDKARGALISEVAEKSPAAAAGLQKGDVIIKVDGEEVTDVSTLRNKVALIAPNAKVDVQVIRDGKKKTVTVTIGEQPADMGKAGVTGDGALQNFGLTLQNLTEELANQFGYTSGQGVLIAEVEQGSPADAAGLKPGQLIEEVNRQRVHNLKDLRGALEGAKPEDKVLLFVRSGRYSQYVVLAPATK